MTMPSLAKAADAEQRRLANEQRARREAEQLLEAKARELVQANDTLSRLGDTLAARIAELERSRQEQTARIDALEQQAGEIAALKRQAEQLAKVLLRLGPIDMAGADAGMLRH